MGKVTIFVLSMLLISWSRVFSQPSGTATSCNHTFAYLFVPLPAPAQKIHKLVSHRELNIFDAMGWLGTFFYVLGYLLLTLRKIKSQQTLYHLLNVLGALGLIANALHLGDMPSLVVNIVWFVIGITAIGWMVMKKA